MNCLWSLYIKQLVYVHGKRRSENGDGRSYSVNSPSVVYLLLLCHFCVGNWAFFLLMNRKWTSKG